VALPLQRHLAAQTCPQSPTAIIVSEGLNAKAPLSAMRHKGLALLEWHYKKAGGLIDTVRDTPRVLSVWGQLVHNPALPIRDSGTADEREMSSPMLDESVSPGSTCTGCIFSPDALYFSQKRNTDCHFAVIVIDCINNRPIAASSI